MHTAVITMNNQQQEVVSFVPQLTGELAIVDLKTLQRLTELLPTANLRDIKERLIDSIRSANDLQAVCNVMKNELAFHETVNIIKHYESELDRAMEMTDAH